MAVQKIHSETPLFPMPSQHIRHFLEAIQVLGVELAMNVIDPRKIRPLERLHFASPYMIRSTDG
jgi:hypothetical protein